MRLVYLGLLLVNFHLFLPLHGAEVHNQETPQGVAQTLVFKQDLRFGADQGGDEYLWTKHNTNVAVDARGHLFVADTQENRILEFDPKGRFVRVAASKGQGPGELFALNSIQILPEGTVITHEGSTGVPPRVNFYDADMKFESAHANQNFSRIITAAVFAPKRALAACTFVKLNSEERKMTTTYGILNNEYELVKTLAVHEQVIDFQNFTKPKTLSEFMGTLLAANLGKVGVVAFDPQGRVYLATSDAYKIEVWDAGLKNRIRTITRKFEPIYRRAEETRAAAERLVNTYRQAPNLAQVIGHNFEERVIQNAELPAAKNPIQGLFPMPSGHLLVIHNVDLENGSQTADIFDPKGHFLGQTKLDNWAFLTQDLRPRMVFQGKYAYTVETDKDENNTVVRYSYAVAPVKPGS